MTTPSYINIANCQKLSAYLKTLPEDYVDFGMSGFIFPKDYDALINYAVHNGGVHTCGTAACAVGHGPSAGILFPEPSEDSPMWRRDAMMLYPEGISGPARYVDGDENGHCKLAPNWHAYSRQFVDFEAPDEVGHKTPYYWWEWCFGSMWSSIDDTPKGAAARIDYMLANAKDGLPYIDSMCDTFNDDALYHATLSEAGKEEMLKVYLP